MISNLREAWGTFAEGPARGEPAALWPPTQGGERPTWRALGPRAGKGRGWQNASGKRWCFNMGYIQNIQNILEGGTG